MDTWAWGVILFVVILLVLVLIFFAYVPKLAAGSTCTSGIQCTSNNCAPKEPLIGSPLVCCPGVTATTPNGMIYCANLSS